MMTLDFCKQLPKIELHAHLNGSLSVSTIGKLVRLHKQSFPEEVVPPAADIFQDPKSFDDGYAIFKCAQALVDHPEAVKLAASSVLKEFAEENVLYLELRSTPRHCEGKMSKRQYIEAMIEAVKEQDSIATTILVSIDRRKSLDEANENVSLALEFHQKYPDIVVGVDLSGDARINKLQDFYPALSKAQQSGLRISMHFAEESNASEIEFVLSQTDFRPDRLGHCTHVYSFWSKFVELQIPTEICMTSNVKCGSVKSYEDHHLKRFHESNLPYCICTDDKGVFNCSSSEEHHRAMQLLGLNHQEMFSQSLKCIDFIFAPELMHHVQTLNGHSGRVWHCAWNPQGTLLATCGEDTNIRLWSKEGDAWKCQTILAEAHTRTVRRVDWSPCGNYISSASFDGTVAVWDRKSGQFECSATLEGHENEVKCATWSKSGNFLASCSRDKSVWIWDVDQEEDEFMCAAVLQAHTADVKRVVWHPQEDLVASASYDNKIKMFKEDSDDWVCCGSLGSHENTVWSLAFNSTGQRLASASEDTTVKIWQEYKPGNSEGIATQGNDATWKCVTTLGGFHTRPVYDVDWCHQTDLIATACGDDSIRVFKEDTSEDKVNAPNFSCQINMSSAHEQDVNCVAWNPKNRGLLASCGDEGMIKLWQL